FKHYSMPTVRHCGRSRSFSSSRRRHTRFSRDWSSDVCSSDLINTLEYIVNPTPTAAVSFAKKEFCYEDDPALIEGQQVKSWFEIDRKSTRLNSSHVKISYAVFCLKKKKNSKSIGYEA